MSADDGEWMRADAAQAEFDRLATCVLALEAQNAKLLEESHEDFESTERQLAAMTAQVQALENVLSNIQDSVNRLHKFTLSTLGKPDMITVENMAINLLEYVERASWKDTSGEPGRLKT